MKNNEDAKRIHKGYYTGRNISWVNWGKPFYDDIKMLQVSSVCDVGCGNGMFVNDMVSMGMKEVYGVDLVTVAMNLVIKNDGIEYHDSVANNLPLEDNSVDLLTAFDVLEHIAPSEVESSLEEFARVSKKYMMFSISHRQSGEEHEGENLHLTVQPFDWWSEKISKHATLLKRFPGSNGNTNCIWAIK